MTRTAALFLAQLLALAVIAAGPVFSAGAPADSGGTGTQEDPAVEEDMLPHPVTLPGSYVALPDAIVMKIRNKILISRGEEPMDDGHAEQKSGGH